MTYKSKFVLFDYLWTIDFNHKPNNKLFHLTAQRAQGETETTIETEGHEEGS